VQLMKHRRLALLAVPLALSMVVSACGGDDDDDDTGGGGGENAAGVPPCLSFADLYALTGPESEGFSNWTDAQDLATELGSDTEFPDAPLDVTGPGEESGTYDSFIEIALGDIIEERGQEETTRPDYEASADDNTIISNVEASDSSLGWVGFAYAEEQGDAVTEIEVAAEPNGECVAPSAETIGDGSYPLSRSLYIYVNSAKAEENPALAAFVDFYLGDLETWVTEGGYVALPDDRATATQQAWEDAGISGEGDISGNINISGSSTVEPISSIVAEEFDGENGTTTAVDGPGTGDGFELFCNGETDISDASRQIDDEEMAACESNGVEYVELEIGIDGMSVLTAGS
jgi:ABC-type phosphate transport system substrate-binding protein